MQYVIVVALFIGLAVLIIRIRQRLFDNKDRPPEKDMGILNTPIDQAETAELHNTNENIIPVYKFSNIVEAGTLKALLEDNGIDCMVNSFHNSAYDGPWQSQKGWGILKVPAKDQDKAENLIDAFLKDKNTLASKKVMPEADPPSA